MNKEDRQQYSSLYIKQVKRYESKYLRKIFNALKSQVDAFVTVMTEQGLQPAKNQLNLTVINDQIGPVIRDLYVEVGLFFGRKAWREIQRSTKKVQKAANFGFNQQWANDIIKFFQIFLLNDAVIPITETTKNQILNILEQATNEGWSIDQIARKLQSPELLLWRARLIARTEIAKAAFEGRKLADRDNEYETQKEWIAANDHRTRHGHRKVDGEVIDFDMQFQVPTEKGVIDMMQGPGDPTASAANVINCRCSTALTAKRDENGRLLRKTGVSVIRPAQVQRPLTITI
jgi:uncharacterized protein with gpF-like domain